MINKITLKNSVRIINNEYVVKKKKTKITDTYNYLLSRSFNYFPEIIKEDSDHIYYKYINDIAEPDEQKIIDLINVVAVLHNKTTIYKEVDIDYYKNIYESINEEIDDTYKYYNNLMDNIDNEVYMSPANYLIARNISLVYQSLNYSKESIKEWYDLIEDKRKVRVVTLHNNLSLEHYLKEEKPYLISWDNSKIDMPIYDLVSLYKNNCLNFEFSDLLKTYLYKYPLTSEELLLFLTIISIPNKIANKESEYARVVYIRKQLDYLYKTSKLREEYRVEDKEKESQKLQE